MHDRRRERRKTRNYRKIERRERREARKRDKPYRRQRNSAITAIIILLLFFVFAGTHVVHFLFNRITTESIPLETIALAGNAPPVLLEGIIIRDETLYTAPISGVVEYYVNNFTRLRPNTVAASIQQYEILQNLQPRIATHERELRRIGELSGNLNDPAVLHVDAQIENMLNNRLSRNIHTNMAEIYALRDGILQNIAARNQIIMTGGANIGLELDYQRRFIEQQLAENRAEIRITGGGIISPLIDGFEELLTPQNMYGLTAAQTRAGAVGEPPPRREVEEGEPVFKIVRNNRWFIAAHIPNEQAQELHAGQRQLLYIEGTAPLEVQIHSAERGASDTLVIFRTNNFLAEFLPLRGVSFSMVEEQEPALRIPTSAITTRRYLRIPLEFLHGREPQYVRRVFGVEYEPIPVTASVSTDEYIYIADNLGLRPGDTLQNGSAHFTIETPRETEGVYRVVYGMAAFTTIYREEEEPGAIYTFLNPRLNPSLRENSEIVRYASMVEDGQIVILRVR